jgi:hypothetical protein
MLVGAVIVTIDDGAFRSGVHNFGISRIGRDISAFTTANFVAILAGDDAVWWSKTGVQLMPPSVLLKIPPATAPK